MAITLQDLAFGEMFKDADTGQYLARLIGVANVSQMSVEALGYLGDHLTELMERSEEQGYAQQGWWLNGRPPQELSALLPKRPDDFGTATSASFGRLTAPGNASAGLLAVGRFQGKRPHLAILKLDINQQDLYRFAAEADAEGVIQYEHLEDVLPSTGVLKKAALIPNPGGAGDLRVVDDEAGDRTATYWLNFLGARVDPPAPRVFSVTMEATTAVLAAHAGAKKVHEAMGAALQEVVKAPTPARQFVNRVADECDVPRDTAWEGVKTWAGTRLSEDAVLSPQTLGKVHTEIIFRVGGQQVTVRGPAEALEGHFDIEPAANGYVLTIRTDNEPKVRQRLKPGR